MEKLYKHYLLSVLLVLLAFNYVDRLALGLALQNIKGDLGLSDTQLGFLTGVAFALFYAVMGIPIARWADRGNRVAIIALTVGLWGVMVALCGMAGSFAQLLLIRIGVAVGEAGFMPPANSLIPDYFSRAERPRAVAIYMVGGCLGVAIAYFVAGWLNELYGWRAMFLMLGLPGLPLAALVWFTLREPRQVKPTPDSSSAINLNTAAAGRSEWFSLKEVCRTLWVKKTFRHLLFTFAVTCFLGYGIAQWLPAFFVRSYGLKTGELGTWLAVLYGFGGMLGTYTGGALASRFARDDERLQLRAAAIVVAVFGLLPSLIYISHSRYVGFALMGVSAVGLNTITGPVFSTIQTIVPERMRALSIAIIYLFANLIGMGLGPLATGVLSDALRPWLGEESLRYALLILCPGYLWGGWHLWRASRTVMCDLEAVQLGSEGPRKDNVAQSIGSASLTRSCPALPTSEEP